MKIRYFVGLALAFAFVSSTSIAANSVVWEKTVPNVYIDSSAVNKPFTMDYDYRFNVGADTAENKGEEMYMDDVKNSYVTTFLNMMNNNNHPTAHNLQAFELSEFKLYRSDASQPFCDVISQLHGAPANIHIKLLSDAAHHGVYCIVDED